MNPCRGFVSRPNTPSPPFHTRPTGPSYASMREPIAHRSQHVIPLLIRRRVLSAPSSRCYHRREAMGTRFGTFFHKYSVKAGDIVDAGIKCLVNLGLLAPGSAGWVRTPQGSTRNGAGPVPEESLPCPSWSWSCLGWSSASGQFRAPWTALALR